MRATENVEDFMQDDERKKDSSKSKRRQLGLSCMLNTEVGAVLAAIRRPELTPLYNNMSSSEETYDSSLVSSLRSLRSLIFNPHQEWRTVDPSLYLAPFLDVIQSDDVPASPPASPSLPFSRFSSSKCSTTSRRARERPWSPLSPGSPAAGSRKPTRLLRTRS
ncbi:ARF guanine-nucleotide exchange factor GNL2 [Spatholobus suberectus]|nr:ARF guanine-nucleotide exchange factor GNL2 [Spatholobus suberectus]